MIKFEFKHAMWTNQEVSRSYTPPALAPAKDSTTTEQSQYGRYCLPRVGARAAGCWPRHLSRANLLPTIGQPLPTLARMVAHHVGISLRLRDDYAL
jgi:hypothetical protein